MLQALALAERDTLIDPLTGLWNKRGLDEILDREVDRAKREGISLAVCKVLIDPNPLAADEAVKTIAETLVAQCPGRRYRRPLW